MAKPKDQAPPSKQKIRRKLNSNRLFLGGVDPILEKEDILNYFSKFGEVEDIELKNKETKKRNFGFLSFKNSEDILKVILYGKFHIIKNIKIEVNRAFPKNDYFQKNQNKFLKNFFATLDDSIRSSSNPYNQLYSYGYSKNFIPEVISFDNLLPQHDEEKFNFFARNNAPPGLESTKDFNSRLLFEDNQNNMVQTNKPKTLLGFNKKSNKHNKEKDRTNKLLANPLNKKFSKNLKTNDCKNNFNGDSIFSIDNNSFKKNCSESNQFIQNIITQTKSRKKSFEGYSLF